MDMQAELPREKIATVPESTLKLAEAHGKFYNSLLDTYLSRSNEAQKQEQIQQLLGELPPHARRLYEKGLKDFQQETAKNAKLLDENRGQEPEYLISCVLRESGKSEEEIDKVVQNISKERPRFVEPVTGVAILQVEHEAYNYLEEAGVVIDSDAAFLGAPNEDLPSFLIVRRRRMEKGLDENQEGPEKNPTVLHEFHHFITHFLERGDIMRPPQGATPEEAKAFGFFRDEVSAYIIGKSEWRFAEVPPDDMVYTRDKQILQRADNGKLFVNACIVFAKAKGVDTNLFLYPAMTSRSFDDLKHKFLAFTPIDNVDIDILKSMYSLWWQKRWASSDIGPVLLEVVQEKGLTISPEVLKAFGSELLASPRMRSYGDNIASLEDYQRAAEDFKTFAESININGLPIDDMLRDTLHGELPLPDEAINYLLTTPDAAEHVKVTTNPIEFVSTYFNPWYIREEADVKLRSHLLSLTPELRNAFDSYKDQAAKQFSDEYRMEMSGEYKDEEGKRQLEQEIQQRLQFFRSL